MFRNASLLESIRRQFFILDFLLAQPNAVESLSNTLLSIWKFPTFYASRWITVGMSCRTLTPGLLTGYGGLFAIMGSTGALNEYDSQGSMRVSEEVMQTCVLGGSIVYVAEIFTRLAMPDPGLVRQPNALEKTVLDELRYLENLQPFVWTHLASIGKSRGWISRDNLAAGAIASAFHLHKRVFLKFSSLPWVLLRQGPPERVLSEIEGFPV